MMKNLTMVLAATSLVTNPLAAGSFATEEAENNAVAKATGVWESCITENFDYVHLVMFTAESGYELEGYLYTDEQRAAFAKNRQEGIELAQEIGCDAAGQRIVDLFK